MSTETRPVTIGPVFIEGQPKGQPRPRAFARGGVARVYDPGTAEGWKSAIALGLRDARPEAPLVGPVRVYATFYMPRPKRLMRKSDSDHTIPHVAKPDIDNLLKAVFDACTQLGVWEDDAQVVDLSTTKAYAPKHHRAGLYITIEEVTQWVTSSSR